MTTTERYAPFLLWADSETTGLNHDTDTVLEMGWFVTCADGIPITPVRSRYTALHADDSPVIPEEGGYWDDGPRAPSLYVRDMHDTSNLTAEHAIAQGEGTVIDSPAALERLMLDDLQQAWQITAARNPEDPDDVQASTLSRIAGAGVAHFEHVQFGLYFPRLAAALHYAPHDVSGALRVITRGRGPRSTSGIDAILDANPERAAKLARELMVGPWPTFGLRNQMADDPSRTPLTWVRESGAPHRAAADAARAWVAYRLLFDQGATIPHRSIPTA